MSFQPLVLLVNPAKPAKDFASFLALARREPGKLTMGTAGAGSFTHLAGLLLEHGADVHFEAVHYRHGSSAWPTSWQGRSRLQFGRSLRLATLSDAASRHWRSPRSSGATLRDVPTVAESGVPNYEAINLLGLIAPAATPAPIIDHLSKAMKQV